MRKIAICALVAAAAALPLGAQAEVSELHIPLGAGGFGFLPLHMMHKHGLIEKQAAKAGVKVSVNWANIGGPSVMIDALLSGSAHFISAGPPSFLILWDKTGGKVKGVAAMSSMPMSLNTRAAHLKSVDDITGSDKIAVTSVKSSIPSIIMQMHAAVALLSGSSNIVAHYASAPLSQRELKESGIRSIMNTDDVMGGSTTFTMVSTTTKFHDENPKVYAAFVAALEEAQAMIKADPRGAAAVLIESMGGGTAFSADDMVAILKDPATKYTTRPENVMKYANFMNDIGSLKHRPKSITELFFDGSDITSGN